MKKVERAAIEDWKIVCALDCSVIGNESRAEYLLNAIQDGRMLLVRMKESCAGFVVFSTTFFGHCFIDLLIVADELRRNGIARQLLAYVEEHIATDKLFTSTNESNVVMQQVCQSLGFVKSGKIENLDVNDPEMIYFKQVYKEAVRS